MRVVIGLAVAALVALVIAVLTSSTLASVLVVLLAGLGIVLLIRDWRANPSTESTAVPHDEQAAAEPGSLQAGDLSPDIAAEPEN